jgi:YVTN family beta-propeller protein
MRRSATAAVAALVLSALAGCSGGSSQPTAGETNTSPKRADTRARKRVAPRDVYAADRPNALSAVVRHFPARVYVPNSESDTVDVIDPHSYRVVAHFATGALPQHVTPSWDLKTLWVDNDEGNSLTPVNPRTGRPGRPVPVRDPYNLYFTPDGRHAVVVAERLRRLDFRTPHTMRLQRSVAVPCPGVDHLDFTAAGRALLASCEFGGKLVVVGLRHERVIRSVRLRPGAMPQDVKLSPDGRVFYVADMASNGVWLVDAHSFRRLGFVHTGRGAHGLYPSRDSRRLFVSNRDEGSISVIAFRTRRRVGKWRLPGGGSPDMGGVSADGRVLWLSGRYDSEVYAISTRTGRLIRRIPVGNGPHGLCVYPQPGRYSLGHTGVLR